MTRSENRNQLRTMRWSSSLVIAIVCFLVPLAAKAANSDAETEKVYGKKISGQQIFAGSVRAPPQAAELLSTLQEKSPSNASRGKS